MKNIFMVATIMVIATACQHATVPVATPVTHNEIKATSGQIILAGHNPHSVFGEAAYKPWFDKSYEGYIVDSSSVAQLQPVIKKYSMDIFLGSWCGDSKREVPRMMKVLQYAGMDTAQVSLIFVDNSISRYKQSPGHEERNRSIHRVPTFIVYEDKKEIGRIVESPVVGLEKDLLSIIRQQDYQPNYKGVNYWVKKGYDKDTYLDDEKLGHMAGTVKPLCKHYGEFNTYGYVLLAAGKKTGALNVFRLNTLMYPDTPGVFDSLGEAYSITGNKPAAIAAYQKVLQLKPGDANAVKMLAELK